jgi:hypothetical protein
MSDEYTDTSGNTAQFQAFVNRPEEPAPARKAPVGLIAGIVVVVLVIAIVVFLLAT